VARDDGGRRVETAVGRGRKASQQFEVGRLEAQLGAVGGNRSGGRELALLEDFFGSPALNISVATYLPRGSGPTSPR